MASVKVEIADLDRLERRLAAAPAHDGGVGFPVGGDGGAASARPRSPEERDGDRTGTNVGGVAALAR